jgi:hypothetical protein
MANVRIREQAEYALTTFSRWFFHAVRVRRDQYTVGLLTVTALVVIS